MNKFLNHKRWFVTAAASVVAIALGATGVTSAAAATPKPKVLKMLYATAEANSDAILTQVAKFEKEFGITLKVDTLPMTALQPKVYSELATGSKYYDIIIADTSWMPTLAKKMQPLSSFISNPDLNTAKGSELTDFIPKVFYDTVVYDVRNVQKAYPNPTQVPNIASIKKAGFDVLGLPIQANALTMAYRKDLFNDASQKAAFKAKYGKELTVPTTLAEYATVAKFFTQPDKKLYGTTMMAGVGDWSTDDFKTILAGFGGNGRLLGDNNSLDFNSAAGIKALTWYRDLIESGATPPGTTSASWDEVASSFNSGQTAMTWQYHALALEAGIKGEIAYTQVPKGPNGNGPHFGTWMLSVNPKGTNKEWSYKAISWLTASPQQIDMARKKELHASRLSVYKAVTSDPFYTVLGQALKNGVGRPRVSNYFPDISQAIGVGVNQAASGAKSPKQALADTAAVVRAALEKVGYKVPK